MPETKTYPRRVFALIRGLSRPATGPAPAAAPPEGTRAAKVLRRGLTILLYGLFLGGSLLYLGVPGLVAEEAFIGLTASTYLKDLLTGPSEAGAWSLLPPALGPYKGPTTPLLMSMLMGVFGNSVFVLRSLYVAFSLGSLLCIQFVLGRWFNRTIALGTVLLLGVNSMFIQATRVGALRNETAQIFFFWAGLALVQLAMERRSRRYLFGAAFVFGLGLAAKVMMLGYLLAAGLTLLASGRLRRAMADTFGPPLKTFLGVAGSMLAGCTFLILHHVSQGLSSLQWILWNFAEGNQHGWDNTDLIGNLGTRLQDVWWMLSDRFTTENIPTTENTIFPYLVVLSLIGIPALLRFAKRPALRGGPIASLGLLYGLLLLSTCLVPTNHHSEHVLILLPAPQIAVSLFLFMLFIAWKSPLAGRACVVLLLVPVLAVEVWSGVGLLDDIRNERMGGERTRVLYDVAAHLEEKGIRRIAPMNDENDLSLLYITDLQVSLSFGETWPKETLKGTKNKVTEHNTGHRHAVRQGRVPADVLLSYITAAPPEEDGRYYLPIAPEHPRWSFVLWDVEDLLRLRGRPLRLERRFAAAADQPGLALYSFE